MAKINLKGVGTVPDGNVFEFTTPPPKQRGKGICKKKTAHGGLSITQDGAYYFYCKVYKNEGLDYAEVMRKELEEALS